MYGISYSLIYATSHPIIISFELEKRSLLSLHLLPVIMALWSNTVLLYECNCFFLLLYWNLHTMYNYLYLSEQTPYYLLFYYWVSIKKQKKNSDEIHIMLYKRLSFSNVYRCSVSARSWTIPNVFTVDLALTNFTPGYFYYLEFWAH